MLRSKRYKFNYYVRASPQLFDLQEDPYELNNLANLERYQTTISDLEIELRKLVDPEIVDMRAKKDQLDKVQTLGGKGVVCAKGAFDHSPTPGETPSYRHHT